MASYTVKIQQLDTTVEVEPDETLLDAALRANLNIPSDCRSGVCGTCKCALISGQVHMDDYLEVALEPEEVEQGFILACRSRPTTSCEIQLLDMDAASPAPLIEETARVLSIERPTKDIAVVKLAFDRDITFAFKSGQYAGIRFGELDERYFSFANSPSDKVAEFHIRSVPGGKVSPVVYETLETGSKAIVRGPRGLAYLRDVHQGPIILCAGGSGLAPVASILRTLASTRSPRNVYLYFGVRAEEDVYLEEEILRLVNSIDGANATVVLSAPSGPSERRTGFLAQALDDDFTEFSGMKAYLCGPPIMIETCRRVLLAKGLDRMDCHSDVFWTPEGR